MADNQGKKEQKKRKAQAKQNKVERAEMRKKNSDKGRSLEEMYVYVDEFGNLSSVPSDPSKRKAVDLSEITFQTEPTQNHPAQADSLRTGTVQYFSQSKGFGFIVDSLTGDRIFVHASELSRPVTENEQVTFEKQRNAKGFFATNVSFPQV